MDNKFETPRMTAEVMPDPEQMDVEETVTRRVATMAVAGASGAVIENVVLTTVSTVHARTPQATVYMGGGAERSASDWRVKRMRDRS